MGKLGGLIKTQLVKNKKKRKPDPRVWIFSSTDNSHYNYNCTFKQGTVNNGYNQKATISNQEIYHYPLIPLKHNNFSFQTSINNNLCM